MEVLIRLLIALLLYFLGSSSTVSTPQDAGNNEPTFRSPTIIESVEVVVMESYPMQLQLIVKGQHPDGCDYPVTVEQERVDNTVTVEIYRELPLAVICAAVLLPYEETIPLEGGFEVGSYTIIVNDYIIEQEL